MRITLVILTLLGLFLLASCSQKRAAKINHIVFFKLQEPADTTELILDCDRDLSDISGVTSYYCGQHGDFGRKNVETDYDVGFYVGFESVEAYQAYLTDSNHVALVGKWKPRWEWIRIYDVVDNTP